MSDYSGIAQIITAIGIAAVALYTVWAKLQLDKLTLSLKKVEANVEKVELATNSMKDALVKATGDAALAEGIAKGRAEQKAEAYQKIQDDKLEAYQLKDQSDSGTENQTR